MRTTAVPIFILSALILLVGCPGDATRVYVTAPFNEETELAEVRAVWRNTGEERAFAEASRLAEAQVRFQYKVDVRNLLEHALYLRLGSFELVDDDRLSLAKADDQVQCVLGAGKSEALLEGAIWVPKRWAKKVTGFRLDRFGVPLSDRGRAMYRQWLLQSRPEDAAVIDAELARYAAAPPCL
jgi:hypothetical protein